MYNLTRETIDTWLDHEKYIEIAKEYKNSQTYLEHTMYQLGNVFFFFPFSIVIDTILFPFLLVNYLFGKVAGVLK